ncbi:MAG: tetratricopeptide repeat protein [Pseudomonadota bacterium]
MRRFLVLALAASCLTPAVATAQSAVEGRVDRLEREMRAVQRTVFPGGAGKYVQPELNPTGGSATAPGTPATSPVADLDTRLVALERQQATLTGQIEQNGFRIRQVEEAFAAYKRTTDARLKALEDGASTPGSTEPVGLTRPPATTPPRATTIANTATTTRPPATKPAAKPVADPARAAQVAAVERPETGDAGEDAYVYGFRLYSAKLYPEAEAALKDTVAKYPKHRRASYAQNLLGRAYLDEGRPSLASLALYESFKKYPDGERAPDSLYYLAQSLMKLNKPAEACKVYSELTASYGDKITAQMRADVARGRTAAKCQ